MRYRTRRARGIGQELARWCSLWVLRHRGPSANVCVCAFWSDVVDECHTSVAAWFDRYCISGALHTNSNSLYRNRTLVGSFVRVCVLRLIFRSKRVVRRIFRLRRISLLVLWLSADSAHEGGKSTCLVTKESSRVRLMVTNQHGVWKSVSGIRNLRHGGHFGIFRCSVAFSNYVALVRGVMCSNMFPCQNDRGVLMVTYFGREWCPEALGYNITIPIS